jgi:hypothetical protein
MEPKTVLERRDQVQVLDVRKNDEWAEPAKQMMQRRKSRPRQRDGNPPCVERRLSDVVYAALRADRSITAYLLPA